MFRRKAWKHGETRPNAKHRQTLCEGCPELVAWGRVLGGQNSNIQSDLTSHAMYVRGHMKYQDTHTHTHMCTKYDALGLNDACPEAAKVVQTAWSKPLEKLNSFEVSRLNPTTRNVERRVQVPSAVALYCKPQQRSGPVLMRSRDQVGSSPITRQVSRRQQDGNVAYLGILLMELRT